MSLAGVVGLAAAGGGVVPGVTVDERGVHRIGGGARIADTGAGGAGVGDQTLDIEAAVGVDEGERASGRIDPALQGNGDLTGARANDELGDAGGAGVMNVQGGTRGTVADRELAREVVVDEGGRVLGESTVGVDERHRAGG